MCRADLHIHSNASDGAATPLELVSLLASRGISVFAITDHETVKNVPALVSEAEQHGLRCIPGIEIAVRADEELHIVGLGIDVDSPTLKSYTKSHDHKVLRRMYRLITILSDMCLPYDADKLKRLKVRPNYESIAAVMPRESDVTPQQVQMVLNRLQSCERDERPTLVEAVTLIHEAYGHAVYAHPLRVNKDIDDFMKCFHECVDSGIDGMEVFYPNATQSEQSTLYSLCVEHGIWISGGSDYHSETADTLAGWDYASFDCPRGNLLATLIGIKITTR